MYTTNGITHNDVNRNPGNRIASSGRQVEIPLGNGQLPVGRHPAPDQNEREEEAAAEEPAAAAEEPAVHQGRRKWTREQNKEIWKCYSQSNPLERGYRRRMHDIWQDRNNPPETEQRLADQVRNIKAKNWLSKIEREEIERPPLPHQEREEEQEFQMLINERRNIQEVQDNIVQESTEEERVQLNKIRQWMEADGERARIPTLKAYNQKKLKEKTKNVNEILRLIPTNNITETNNLAYAGAKLVVELMEIRTPTIPNDQSPNQPPWKKQPPWKRRLDNQVKELREDLSKLKEMAENRLRNRKTRKNLNEKYNVQEKGLNNIIEDLIQRLKAKAHTIQRYTNRNKGYQQNKLFETNQKRLYSQLKGEDNQQEDPENEPCKRLWEGIWNNPVSHNKQAAWLQEVKTEEGGRIKQKSQLESPWS